MPLLTTGAGGKGSVGGGGGGSITFTETFAAFGGGGTSVTLGGSIGAAAVGDRLIVAINSDGPAATGVSAGSTIMTMADSEGTGVSGLELWYCTVAAGTTGTLTVTSGGSMANVGAIMGFITGSATSTPSTTTHTAASFSDPGTITLTVPTNGVMIAIFSMNTTGAGSWSNGTTVANISDGSNRFTMGVNTTVGSQTMTFPSNGGNQNHLVALAWAP